MPNRSSDLCRNVAPSIRVSSEGFKRGLIKKWRKQVADARRGLFGDSPCVRVGGYLRRKTMKQGEFSSYMSDLFERWNHPRSSQESDK